MRPDLTWLVTGSVLIGSFLFSLASLQMEEGVVQLDSDQFFHLSRARQVLLGELPFRDFYDPGISLRIYASTLFQLLFGHNLLGEMFLCLGLLSVSYTLVFLLGTQVSGSRAIGLLATLLVVALLIEPHNYPKIFSQLLALTLIWRYAERPSVSRLSLVALGTAVAFLFRHDYGVYGGLAAGATLVTVHWRRGFRGLARISGLYGLSLVALLLPFFVFLQLNGGILPYLESSTSYIRAHNLQGPGTLLPLGSDFTRGTSEISVRWSPDVTPATRERLEERYRLRGGKHDEGRTWKYEAVGPSPDDLRALAADRRVEDTHGIDRKTGYLASDRLQIVLHDPERRLATLVTLLPWLACFVLLARQVLRFLCAIGDVPHEVPRVVGLIVLAATANPVLLREPTAQRLADAASPAALLGAWLIGLLLGVRSYGQRSADPASGAARPGLPTGARLERWLPAPSTALRAGLAVLVLGVTWMTVLSTAPTLERLRESRIRAGPAAAWLRLERLVSFLGATPPIEAFSAESTGRPAVFRYIAACLKPTDRLLIASDRAIYDHYFYSGRGFAGGQPAFSPGQQSSTIDQQRTLARLRTQSVPLALLDSAGERLFESNFPLVHRYLLTHYQVGQESSFGDNRRGAIRYRILTAREARPTGIYEPLSLPCFA